MHINHKMFVDVDFNRVLNHSMINESTKKNIANCYWKKIFSCIFIEEM